MSNTTCTHGFWFGPDAHIADECPSCDYCPTCDTIREYDGEVCRTCGRTWGVA